MLQVYRPDKDGMGRRKFGKSLLLFQRERERDRQRVRQNRKKVKRNKAKLCAINVLLT